MRTCKFKNHEVEDKDFGTQRYCRFCWRIYKKERRQIRIQGKRLADVAELLRLNKKEPA